MFIHVYTYSEKVLFVCCSNRPSVHVASKFDPHFPVEQSTTTGWRRPAGLSRHDPIFNSYLRI